MIFSFLLSYTGLVYFHFSQFFVLSLYLHIILLKCPVLILADIAGHFIGKKASRYRFFLKKPFTKKNFLKKSQKSQFMQKLGRRSNEKMSLIIVPFGSLADASKFSKICPATYLDLYFFFFRPNTMLVNLSLREIW